MAYTWNNDIHVKVKNVSEPWSLVIYDLNGVLLYNGPASNGEEQIYNWQSAVSGVYIVSAFVGNQYKPSQRVQKIF